jgi:hypothetical protein
MSAWSKLLGPDERAEVESGVVAAYIDPETGETRPTSAAKAEFVEFVRTAERQGREWAGILLDEWAERGAGNFAAELWKRRDAFTATVKGVQRSRSLHRGKKVRTADGTSLDVQASLLDWSLDDLKEGLVAEAMRAKEARINLDTYAALIRLCDDTGKQPVSVALAAIGKSIDEYLAEQDDEQRTA